MNKPIPRKTTAVAQKNLSPKFHNNFCSTPFSQLFIQTNGNVYFCCNNIGLLGNLKTHTLDELWNGEEAKKIRAEFLSGNPILCKNNMEQLGCHINYDDLLKYANLEVSQKNAPASLEINLNGKCNIDCIMCETKNELQSVLSIEQFDGEIIKKTFPTLKRIHIKGGEPFIQKETYSVINKLSTLNKKCAYHFTTNAQYNFNKKLQDEFKKINIENITFSVDSSNPTIFSEIRRGGSLQKAENTMDDIKTWLEKNFNNSKPTLGVNITVQKKNWMDIPQTFRHYHQKGFSPCLIYVYYPHTFSLSSLDVKTVVEILKFYIELPLDYNQYMGSFYHALKPLLLKTDPQIKKLKLLWDLRMVEINKNQST